MSAVGANSVAMLSGRWFVNAHIPMVTCAPSEPGDLKWIYRKVSNTLE